MLPGAVQPALAAAFDLDLAASGLVASALSLGLGVGVVAGGPLTDRLARRPLFASAAGVAALASLAPLVGGAFSIVLVATAGVGLGSGLYETLLNAAVPERRPERAATRLSLIHACATLGAGAAAPALGALAARHGHVSVYGALAVAFALVAGLGLLVRFPAPPGARPEGGPARAAAGGIGHFALAAFAYVGLETALSVLAAPVAAHAGLAPARGMRALSAFWLALLVARVAFAALRPMARVAQLRLAGAAGALVLSLGAALPGLAPEVVYAAAGLGLGIVFPVLVVLAGEGAPARRATRVGLVVGAGALGGFAVPWLAGALGDRLGAPAAVAALAILAASLVLLPARSR